MSHKQQTCTARSDRDAKQCDQETQPLCLEFSKGRHDFIGMFGYIYLWKDLCHFSILADKKCYAARGMSRVLEYAICSRDMFLFVTYQWKGQSVFCDEFLVGLDTVEAHADNFRIQRSYRLQIVSKAARFLRATRSIISWVEIQHNI